jgi:diadenosine tetraphosphate (Ap4A) HIT family hydrolase
MSDSYCGFCDQERFRSADIYIENDLCIFFAPFDPKLRAEAKLHPDVLPGSGAVIPIAHRAGPFELTSAERSATHDLLIKARAALHEVLAPDGYTLGWNASRLHAHLHVIPRFRDEPPWNSGVRSALNVPDNKRPDPWRRGSGMGMPGAGDTDE